MTYYKQIIIYSVLLIVFTLGACSGNKPLQARYKAEKMFHEAVNSLKEARAFSSKLSTNQQTDIVDQFNSLVEYCYIQLEAIDSSIYPVEFNEFNYMTYQAVTQLSQLYYLDNNYSKCVEITNRILSKVNIPKSQKASVYINLGQSLQSEGNWDSSYAVYNTAINLFSPPLTNKHEIISSIFNLPLYIFRVVKYIKDDVSIASEITKAETYYINYINKFPGQKLETASHANLAKLYEETGQWEKELEQLHLLTDSQSKSYFTILLKTADILGDKLKKLDTALALYEFMFDKTTDDEKDTRAILIFKKALIQIEKKDYDGARTLLHNIKTNYPNVYKQSPLFQYNLAQTFELQNKWNRAEQEYNLLLENFKGSTESMMTLLYLVDNFRDNKQQEEKDRWFARSEAYFKEIAELGKGSLMEARAMLYEADLYYRNDEFSKTNQILTDIFNKFPHSDPGKQALIKSIRLYQEKLDNPAKADSLLEKLKSTLAKVPVLSNNKDLLEN